jgi:NDP-sugar pyrophosphorylase family protein
VFPVVILAGGLATRLRPITEKIPKAMLDIAGKPFIDHQLNLLKEKGIENVILCVGYLGEMIEAHIKNGSAYNLQVTYSYDGDKLLGTGGALRNIGERLPDTFFVLYGDSYLDIEYQKVENAYRLSGKKALMTVYRNEGRWDSSNVIFQNNELIRYSKKNKTEEMNYIDYGLGILNKQIFKEFENVTAFDLAGIYEKLAEEKQLFGYEVFERFYEVGSKEGIKELEQKISGKVNV